jgi:hypothetical protein
MAAIALGCEEKKLKLHRYSDSRKRSLDNKHWITLHNRGKMLGWNGSNPLVKQDDFDFAKTLYTFFNHVSEHDDGEETEKEALLSECFFVEERLSIKDGSDQKAFAGVEFRFGEWPLRREANPLPFAKTVRKHLTSVYEEGEAGNISENIASTSLAYCIWKAKWILRDDLSNDRPVSIPRAEGTRTQKTVVRFMTRGIQFLVHKN